MRAAVHERAAALRRDRVPFVHARVVLAERPTSAKPGDEAVVLGDGTIEGFVGGTCAESTVRAQALALLDSGESLLLRISPVEEAGQPGKLTVVNPCLSGGTLEIFLEPIVPAPELVVLGDTPIAQALVGLGERLGYHVVATVSAPAGADLANTAALVVASHGRDEEATLAAAVDARVPYIGLVASHKRGEAVLADVATSGSATADVSTVHTPAGLDIGARTPEEVALSILAEIVAHRPRPTGRPIADTTSASSADDLAGTAAQPTTAVDPVCGMSVAMVEASLHLDHDGERYWFCGSGCLRAFAANPDAYLSA